MSDWRKLSANILRRADGAEIHRGRTVVDGRKVYRYRAAWSAGTLAEGPDWAAQWRVTLEDAKRDVSGRKPE